MHARGTRSRRSCASSESMFRVIRFTKTSLLQTPGLNQIVWPEEDGRNYQTSPLFWTKVIPRSRAAANLRLDDKSPRTARRGLLDFNAPQVRRNHGGIA